MTPGIATFGSTVATDERSFGYLLRRHRLAALFTQEQLAERAHLSYRTISDLERGAKHTPRRDTVLLLADALELSREERSAFIAAAHPVEQQPAATELPADQVSSQVAVPTVVPPLPAPHPDIPSPLPPVVPGVEERRLVTCLFYESTRLGEQLDPETLRRVMGRYFEAMRTILERHGGTVEKFIGDAVMSVFGIPQVHEDDALRAVRAASEIRDELKSLDDELDRERGIRLQFRTGINTGEVLAGDPSAGQTLVTGDAINVAARLEQAAQPGEIPLTVAHILPTPLSAFDSPSRNVLPSPLSRPSVIAT